MFSSKCSVSACAALMQLVSIKESTGITEYPKVEGKLLTVQSKESLSRMC